MSEKFVAKLGDNEFNVEYYIEPAQKGLCDSMGVPEEPSWGAYVEIGDYGIDERWLSSAAIEEIEKQADKHFEERSNDVL